MRDHEIFEMAAAVAKHVLLSHVGVGAHHNDCLDGLTENGIGKANDGGFSHALELVQNVFHFPRTDLFTASLDDVVPSSDEVQVPFIVHAEGVAGSQYVLAGKRSRHQDLGCFVGTLPVTLHYVRTAHDQLADSARETRAVAVDQIHLFVRHAATD